MSLPYAISFSYIRNEYKYDFYDHDALHVYAGSKEEAEEFGRMWMARQRPEILSYDMKVVGNNPNFIKMINTPKKLKKKHRKPSQVESLQGETSVDTEKDIDF